MCKHAAYNGLPFVLHNANLCKFHVANKDFAVYICVYTLYFYGMKSAV